MFQCTPPLGQLIYAVGLALVSSSMTVPFVLLFKRTGRLAVSTLDAELDAAAHDAAVLSPTGGGGGSGGEGEGGEPVQFGPDGIPLALRRAGGVDGHLAAYRHVLHQVGQK